LSGSTDIADLVLACHDCHILTHEGGHQVSRRPDGTWTLVRPEHPPP
jgi:hypothetical protein